MNWIPVSERLPDADVDVLVYVPGVDSSYVWLGFIENDVWYWDTGSTMDFPVTHWMPLPEPPEVQS